MPRNRKQPMRCKEADRCFFLALISDLGIGQLAGACGAAVVYVTSIGAIKCTLSLILYANNALVCYTTQVSAQYD